MYKEGAPFNPEDDIALHLSKLPSKKEVDFRVAIEAAVRAAQEAAATKDETTPQSAEITPPNYPEVVQIASTLIIEMRNDKLKEAA